MATVLIKNGCSTQTINWLITTRSGTPVTGVLYAGDVLLKNLPADTIEVCFVGFTGDAYVAGPAISGSSTSGVLAGFDTGVTPT